MGNNFSKLIHRPLNLSGQNLSDLHALFHTLFNDSTDKISIQDHLGQVVYQNATRVLFMESLAAVIPTQSWEEKMAALQTQLKNVVATGIADSFLFHCNHAQLTHPVLVLMQNSPILEATGKVVGTLSIGRHSDITQYQENQGIIKQAHYLRALLDTFPFMVWMKDKESHFLACNQTFATTAGVASVYDLEGNTDYDYFAEHAAGYIEDDQEVLATGLPKTVVERIKRSDGEIYWAETFKSPVSINGEVIGTVGYARDIREQIKLHKKMVKKELEYSELVQSIPLSIVRYDKKCRRIFINAYCGKLDGNAINEALGKMPSESWHENTTDMTGQKFQEILQNVMATGQSKAFEMQSVYGQVTVVYLVTVLPERNSRGDVVGALTLASDVTENSQNRQRIEHLAYHDALTDLPNRVLLNDHIVFEIQHATRHEVQFGVLFLDLDNFKSINDTLGHGVGDQLLIEVGHRLSQCVRNYDTVARMGGDEFALLVTNINHLEDLALLAANIVKQFDRPFKVAETEFFVTASIGVASYPQDADNATDLLKYADSAMYLAKKNGGNGYQFYANELTAIASRHLMVETLLRNALAKAEFEVLYQPIFLLNTKTMIGAEALLRWKSPELGLVTPDQFISVAEQRGFIIGIGWWVMDCAFKCAVKWNNLLSQSNLSQVNTRAMVVAINISSKQLMQYDFTKIVSQLLQKTGCEPRWIKFEITESLLLQESTVVKKALTFLNALGIQISIDDFGTGYSALGYLNKFSVSEIKIDRSFITDITSDENHAKLVKSIIAMAVSLDKTLVAEGIETDEQAQLVCDLGCNVGQGFLFSQPISAEAFEKLIQNS